MSSALGRVKPSAMKVLIIGGGGREHALAWKLARSPQVTQLYAAPGNPGMAPLLECVPLPSDDIDGLLHFAKKQAVDWTIAGPEAPLCAGIVDIFRDAGMKIFGPTRAAAQLEGSKVFAKRFMAEFGIPTAEFAVCKDAADIRRYLESHPLPQVIKVDGLAAGKGVFVCHQEADVDQALTQIYDEKRFGDAAQQVLVEGCLTGTEASFLVISDGEHALPLAPAQDHKPIFDGNQGPNTGGMGTFCPTDTLTPDLQEHIMAHIVQPTLAGMRQRGHPFRGVLYTGLMLTTNGPQVLEFNVRFGDPETQVILPRLNTDLIDVFRATDDATLSEMALEWDPRHAVCVVMASEGYPGPYRKGDEIEGLTQIDDPDVIIFHAGTKQQNSKLVTAGGRVLGVTALGKDRNTARERAYRAVQQIHWHGVQYRTDIGK